MNRITNFIALILLAGIISIVSCQPEESATPNPNGDRDNFVGSWKCQEKSTRYNSTSTYTLKIINDTALASYIFIENIYELGNSYKAHAIVNGGLFTIPQQAVSGNTIQGNGNLQSQVLMNMNYWVNDGVVTDTVTAILTKQ